MDSTVYKSALTAIVYPPLAAKLKAENKRLKKRLEKVTGGLPCPGDSVDVMFGRKLTAAEVADILISGLMDGSIVLDTQAARDEELDEARRRKLALSRPQRLTKTRAPLPAPCVQ